MRSNDYIEMAYSLPPKLNAKPISRSVRAGVKFPVGRIHRLLRKGRYANHIASGAPIYMAAVLEYLSAEILMLSGLFGKPKKLTPRKIKLAVSSDKELRQLLQNVTISWGGVIPKIQPEMLSKKKRAKKSKKSAV